MYMENTTGMHLCVAKRILHYMEERRDFKVLYKTNEKSNILYYRDSEYVGEYDERKRTSSYDYMLRSGVISCTTKNKPTVTLSTMKSMIFTLIACACQDIWLRRLCMS